MRFKNPGLIATLVVLIGMPIGIAATRAIEWQGFGLRTWAAPLGLGMAGAIVLLVLALRYRNNGAVAGATAGFFAVWVTMIVTAALRGTPFPFYGLIGDAGRIAAMATRYTTTWASADTIIPNTPGEYPPLFPWMIGRVAVLIGQPAWQLIGIAEAICTGLALLLGFVLWQRLVNPWTAVAVVIVGFMAFPNPAKAYELITLMAFIPWVLSTFAQPEAKTEANPGGKRLHWLASGLVGGFILLTYYGWGIFGIFGIVALIGMSWYKAENRREYLLYLAKVAGVALLTASWFLVPFFYVKQTSGGPTLGDLYGTASILDQMFPFLDLNPLGILQLIGLIGLIWLRGRIWWATPLLTLVVGAYAYRLMTALLFVLTDHTMLGQYTPRLYMTVLTMAGVLTIIHAVPVLAKKLDLTAPKYAGVIALTVAIAYCGFTFTQNWMPKLGGAWSDYTERAYLEPLPDGRYLIDITGEKATPWFPVTPIQQAVEKVYGPNPQRVALSADERLFSYLPWYGYIGNDLGGALAHTFEKHAELDKLAATSDPAEFARASANTRYGPIDIFVLKKKDGLWTWTTHMGYSKAPKTVSFSPGQFDEKLWAVTDLPEGYVVAVRL